MTHNATATQFVADVEIARESAGITHADLATRAGIAPDLLRFELSNPECLTFVHALALSNTLEVSL